ncbi:hypothetical protein D9M73_282060 [compost metagenome]
MFNAQRPHRRQSVAGAIEALLDTRAEQFGEVDVERHGAVSSEIMWLTGTDGAKNQDSVRLAANLYGDNTVWLNL